MKRLQPTLLAALAVMPGTFLSGQEPVFVQRLQLPVAQDDIGYGQAVIADVHTGEIFVCDPRKNRILIFDQEGFFKHQILGGSELSSPEDLAVDPDGLLLVLAGRGNRRLPIELDFDGVFRREVPLEGVGVDLAPPFLRSIAISYDGSRLYLLDGTNLRLWIADRDGRVIRSVDLAADHVDGDRRDMFLGQVDVYGENVLVAVPSDGEIRRFDLDGRPLDRVGRKGTGRCDLGRPTAAALTDDGEYLIVDQQRMLLLHWSATGNRCLGEYIGLGDAPGYLYYPQDVALDGHGRLYIAQSFDGRVQVYEGMPAAGGWLWPGRPTDEESEP